MIGKTISHYKILDKLGEGGMGVVYKAEDTRLRRHVALKFLPPHWTRDSNAQVRFMNEARAASALEHNNICNIHEIDRTDDGQLFIAMAFYEGETIRKKIERGPLRLNEAINLAIQIAEGLVKAHLKDIVHRDLKSANVLVTEDGVAKIVDFGLAKLAGHSMLTKEGTTLGTAAYMSPEQARGEVVDSRTDIFSLGVLLYQMVTGQLPFKGDYEQAIIYSIINEDPEPLTALHADIPLELERIVNQAMAKDPGQRYQSAREILVDLQALAKQLEAGSSKIKSTKTMEANTSFIKNLLNRHVPQILGLYAVLCWAAINLVDWLVNRFILSRHLVDFSLTVLICTLPTIVVITYFHGQSGRHRWTGLEKVGIPLNLLAMAIVLFIFFNDKDLGSAQRAVTVTDEFGNKLDRLVAKSEFRKKIFLFNFRNEAGDSTLWWLTFGIPSATDADLYQDSFFSTTNVGNVWRYFMKEGFNYLSHLPLNVELKIARELHHPFALTGSYSKQDDDFIIKTQLYETRKGRLISEHTYKGANFFGLIDEIGIQVRKDLKVPKAYIEASKNLPVAEILTHSIEAFEYYINGFFEAFVEQATSKWEKAVDVDPDYAIALFDLTSVYYWTGQIAKAKATEKRAMKSRFRQSERDQILSRFRAYHRHGELDKAIALLKMHTDLYPEDVTMLQNLARVYEQNSKFNEATSTWRRLLTQSPEDGEVLIGLSRILIRQERFSDAEANLLEYNRKFPNNAEGYKTLGQLFTNQGDFEGALEAYNRALLIDPEDKAAAHGLKYIDYCKNNKEKLASSSFDPYLGRFKASTESIPMYVITRKGHRFFGAQSGRAGVELYPISDKIFTEDFERELHFIKNARDQVVGFGWTGAAARIIFTKID